MSSIFDPASSSSAAPICPACPACSDSPLSVTANVIGILTFANTLLVGFLLFLSSTGKQIRETPEAVRELIAATDAQFDELRDAQAWLEAESYSLENSAKEDPAGSVLTRSSSVLEDETTRRQGIRLLDRAQLCFIASQRYLERYGKIVSEEENDDGARDTAREEGEMRAGEEIAKPRWRPAARQMLRRARFVAAKEDVIKSTEVRAKALKDFRQFRNRVLERERQRDRQLVREQSRALQEILWMLGKEHADPALDGDAR